jgi:hypothetical protein
MKLRILLACSAALALIPMRAQAQSDDDTAAWFALMVTPYGALPPLMLAPVAKNGGRAMTVALRGGTWKFSDDLFDSPRNSAFGVTVAAPVGSKATLSGTVGYFHPGCPAGETCKGDDMLGVDAEGPFWENTSTQGATRTVLNISLKGSLGFVHSNETDGGNGITFVGAVPFSVRYELASHSMFSAFVAPGMGIGRVSGGGDPSQTGNRPVFSAGAAWTTPAGVGLHLGWTKVVAPDGAGSLPSAVGLSISFAPGGTSH